MTGGEFQEIIDLLGLSQVDAADFLGYNDSTVRRWISGRYKVPHIVALLLAVMVRYKLTPDNVLSLVESDDD